MDENVLLSMIGMLEEFGLDEEKFLKNRQLLILTLSIVDAKARALENVILPYLLKRDSLEPGQTIESIKDEINLETRKILIDELPAVIGRYLSPKDEDDI